VSVNYSKLNLTICVITHYNIARDFSVNLPNKKSWVKPKKEIKRFVKIRII